MRRLLMWLGSDWRLPLSIAVIVGAAFFVSGFGFDAIKETHEAYLRWEFAANQRAVDAKARALPVPVPNTAPPVLAKAFMRSAPGL